MKSIVSMFRRGASNEQVNAVTAEPRDIAAWVRLIAQRADAGLLSPHAMALVNAHELRPGAHAVHAFAPEIAARGGTSLDKFAAAPDANIEAAIEELVKWTTALQCGYSHDVSKGYFIDAEPYIDMQWNQIIYPLIKDLDFTIVLDLACGHGRNTEYLRHHTKELHLVDINQSCIDACHERFGESKDGTRFHYHVTDGNHLRMIAGDSITLVYSWDSMVHFDKLIVRDYLGEIARVLRRGGSAFLHHSNYGEKAPDSNWATNSGTRSDMSAKLMEMYASTVDLEVTSQNIQGLAEGWGEDGLDCVSILHKP